LIVAITPKTVRVVRGRKKAPSKMGAESIATIGYQTNWHAFCLSTSYDYNSDWTPSVGGTLTRWNGRQLNQ
jgi:hypothetical protein